MPDSPLVYLILGATGSGRRQIVADLVDGGLAEGTIPGALLPEDEPADAGEDKLGTVSRWRWTDDSRIEGVLPEEAGAVFFFTRGRANPVDQIEAFKLWLESQGGRLARVITVVNCLLAEQHPPLLAWYDACVHFSDVVLLNHREGVANKWISDFRDRYKSQFFPCLIELIKAHRVRNPLLILEPEALRISHAFDEELDWVAVDGSDGEDGDESEEETEVEPAEDPYFAKFDSGRRVKEIPRIEKYLPPAG